MKLPNYNIYHTTHPDEIAHGGTAVLIRQNIKHHARAKYKQNNIQVTSISLEDNIGEITISAIYCPRNITINTKIMTISSRHSETAFSSEETLIPSIPFWGSKLRNTKRRELFKFCNTT